MPRLTLVGSPDDANRYDPVVLLSQVFRVLTGAGCSPVVGTRDLPAAVDLCRQLLLVVRVRPDAMTRECSRDEPDDDGVREVENTEKNEKNENDEKEVQP
jgi:hypothetical protein